MPTAVRVRIGSVGQVVLERGSLSIVDAAGELRSEIAAKIPSDRAVAVRIFVELDMIELFVDDRHSLVARVPQRTHAGRLSIESDGAGAKVSKMRISAIGPSDYH